jgi:zinc transport system permease protein
MEGLLQYTFFQNALIGLLIISVASALIGTYIVARRLVAISGGVTHACFGGLGLGYYLGLNPIVMAGVFAVASSVGVEWLASRYRVREDSAIAVVWGTGMAIGVLFVFLTPGYVPELNSFLFGNILTVNRSDLWAFAAYLAVLIGFFAWRYREIVVCAFDRDFARVSGLPVKFINYTMTVLVAVCVVLTIRLAGVMLLMSMLSLPQLIAEMFCRRFGGIMWLSVAVSALTALAGLALSTVIDVPCSALIVIVMAATFIAARVAAAVARGRKIGGR